jgi:hypothetical protein
MDIRQFRSGLAQAFEAAGFDRRPIKRSQSSIWVLPGREVERAFWEHAIRRPWGFLLSGSLSIDVPAFREWLTSKFPEDQHGILWSSLLGRHIANEPDMFFAVENEQPPYHEWVGTIRARLAALPDTIEGLLAAEQQPHRLRLVWDNWTAPKAFSYFKAWANNESLENPPPCRLPDGRIVDAAANDAA